MKSYLMIAIMSIMIMGMFMMMTKAADPKPNCPYHKAGCSYTAILDYENKLKAFIASIKGSEFNQTTQMRMNQGMSKLIGEMTKSQQGCLDMIGEGFFTGEKSKNVTFIKSYDTKTFKETFNGCLYMNTTSAEWKNDPCCNYQLRDKQCCRLEEKTVKRKVIGEFTENVEKCCLNPEKMKASLKKLKSTIGSIQNTCSQKFSKALQPFTRMSNAMTKCISRLFSSVTQQTICTEDSDCRTKCNKFHSRCEPEPLTSTGAAQLFVKCLLKNAEPEDLAAFRRGAAGKSNADESQVAAALTKKITSGICVENANPFLTNSNLKTKSACETVTVCNNGGTCGGSGGFCGLLCNQFPAANNTKKVACGSSISFLNTETSCSSKGRCSDGRDRVTEAECTSVDVCTHPAYKNATGCVGRYICQGFPYIDAKCTFNTTASSTCEFGKSYNSDLDICIDFSATTKAACDMKKGEWKMPPSTKEQCERYGRCIGPNGIRTSIPKNKCDCEGYKWTNSFQAVEAKVVKAAYVNAFQWVNKTETVRKYRWEQALDFQKASGLIYETMGKRLFSALVTASQCSLDAAFSIIKRLACDCSTTPGDKCFSKPVETTIEKTPCYPGVEQVITDEASGNKITLGKNACGDSQDGTEIDITLHTTVEVEASTKRAVLETGVEVKSDAGKSICTVVGNGVKLDPAPSGGAELCLNVDSTIDVSSAAFTKARFAVFESEKYALVELDVTNADTAVQHCATVKDNKIYYPAKCDPNAKQNDKDSPASVPLASTFLLAAVGLLAIFAF